MLDRKSIQGNQVPGENQKNVMQVQMPDMKYRQIQQRTFN